MTGTGRRKRVERTITLRFADGTTAEATIEPGFVDLDTEVVVDAHGKRIDQAYVDRVVAELTARRERPGRPSLSGRGGDSAHLSVRVSDDLARSLDQLSAARGVSRSRLVRDVLAEYVRHAS